jgi:N-methylhydantoinase A
MVLHADRAEAAVARLGETLGLDPRETARGILRVVNAHMVRAIKVISLERGHDPRRFSLICFGGAGAMHACSLANELGMHAVLVPPSPGLLSAVGMLGAEFSRELGSSLLRRVEVGEVMGPEVIRRAAAAKLDDAIAFLDRCGVPAERRRVEALCDLRYLGQSFELTVSAGDLLDGRLVGDIVGRFHQRHQWRYGYRLDDRPVEWVSLRLRARGERSRPPTWTAAESERQPKAVEQTAYGPVFERIGLGVDTRLAGPAIIAEYSATTLLRADWQATVLADGALLLTPVAEGGPVKARPSR